MRIFNVKIYVVSFLFVLLSSIPATAFVGHFMCGNTTSGTGYCQYTGTVKTTYVNESGSILIYFNGSFALADISSVGINGVISTTAGYYSIPLSPDYAKLLYSTALTAQATGREVIMQFVASGSGYLKIQKIWLK